jgi:hypothetical protein
MRTALAGIFKFLTGLVYKINGTFTLRKEQISEPHVQYVHYLFPARHKFLSNKCVPEFCYNIVKAESLPFSPLHILIIS